MIEINAGVDVARPADDVFAYLADFENNPRWQRGMRAARWTSEPPVRVGSTYEQEATFLGRRITSNFEVVDVTPGRSVTIRSTGGTFPIEVTRRVEPDGPGRSRVSATVRGAPNGWFRLLTPVMAALVRRSVQGDYERLKEVLENPPA